MQKKERELQRLNVSEMDSSLGKYKFLKLTLKKEKIFGLFYRKGERDPKMASGSSTEEFYQTLKEQILMQTISEHGKRREMSHDF